MNNKNQEFISVRIGLELKKALHKKAKKAQRTLSSYIRLLLLKAIGK